MQHVRLHAQLFFQEPYRPYERSYSDNWINCFFVRSDIYFCHFFANFFPSLAFPCHKIKDGGHNFCKENTKHSPAKITPTLQAIMTFDWLVVIHSYAAISFPLLNKGKERRHLTITQRWQV